MKPPRFEYFSPRSLSETVAILAEHGDGAKVLAGGQSLLPLLNMRLARPSVLVDINRVSRLDTVRPHGTGGVAIGATVRQRSLHGDPTLLDRLPILGTASQFIGHQQIRSRGTICGSLAHADPAAELPALAVALEAEMVASSASGERVLPAADFFVDYLTTVLEPTEVLTEVRFPGPPAGMRWAFLEMSRRHGDFALAGVVAGLSTSDDGSSIKAARLVVFGVAGTPVRASAVEAALVGQPPTDSVLTDAAAEATRLLDPPADVHGSGAYRRALAQTLTVRALQACRESHGTAEPAT
ncbi:MAG: xanthine dehydrogenase family protein subunit M [Chloroflexi bacterium]|nr:xanthine dehydrogenase family protein subunit M [Chloroflexota bacterium]